MNCHDVQPLLARYVDGEADRYEHTLIEQHLSNCRVCSSEVSQLRVTHYRVQRKIKSWATSVVPPARARERLMAQLVDEEETVLQDVVPVSHPPNALNPRSGRMVIVGSLLVGFVILLIILFRPTLLSVDNWLVPTPSRQQSPHIWHEAIMNLVHIFVIPR